MIRNRSFTFVTSSAKRSAALLALILVGALLRLQRLDWQPLWWDEGISVYFATEPLLRMVQLTANDIHPPLYYALLHGWTALFGSAAPAVERLCSVLVGTLTLPVMAWLSLRFYPARPRLMLIATLLLALNPMHLFYSQEVRMYALAMLLGMVSTGFFWMFAQRDAPGRVGWPWWGSWWGYVATTSLALYTIYYSGFLFAAHGVWAIWRFRSQLRRLGQMVAAWFAVGLLYLPWLLYTGGRLVRYVDDKVAADNDTPLGLLAYLYRHALAFTAGHLALDGWAIALLLHAGLVVLLGLLIVALVHGTRRNAEEESTFADSTRALWIVVLLPVAIGFLLNRRLPFFPEGGERLLLFVLPYALLLIARGLDRWWSWRVGKPALLALLLCAATGIATFYSLPRYRDRDYRPIVNHVVQSGRDQDTWLALFPWQVGYWRAYAPFPPMEAAADPDSLPGPRPLLLGQGSLRWGAQIAAQVDAALERGTLWFPAPLSLGSDLPEQIEAYLSEPRGASEVETALVNLEWGWANESTRLSAWARTPSVGPLSAMGADFGAVQLLAAGAAPGTIASANAPLHIALEWDRSPDSALSDPLNVALRLRDSAGRTWAGREYRQPAAPPAPSAQPSTAPYREETGLLVPVGLPPGSYEVLLSLYPAPTETADGDASAAVVPVADNESETTAGTAALSATLADGSRAEWVPIAQIRIEPPATALAAWRLPVQHLLSAPALHEGVALLGYSGYDGTPWLAGDGADVTLFFQRQADTPDRELYISLLDDNGAGVAGWSGWSLPEYPTAAWQSGALVRVPVAFTLPATLASGSYRLVAGLLDPTTGDKTPPTALGRVAVHQRSARFEPTSLDQPMEPPIQFGTHVELMGYDWRVDEAATGAVFELHLHWHVLQTLLPPHHLFVHADSLEPDAAAQTLVQDDGPPRSMTDDGLVAAPTGSWQPGEYLTTVHRIALPEDGEIDPETGLLTLNGAPYPWRVGLYLPETGARLPASAAGEPQGDYAQFPSLD